MIDNRPDYAIKLEYLSILQKGGGHFTFKQDDDPMSQAGPISDIIRNDLDVMISQVMIDPYEIEHISTPPIEVIKIAMFRDPEINKLLNEQQIADFNDFMITGQESEDVMAAIALVRNDWRNIESLSKELKDDISVQKEAVLKNPRAIKYITNPGLDIVEMATVRLNDLFRVMTMVNLDRDHEDSFLPMLIFSNKILSQYYLRNRPPITLGMLLHIKPEIKNNPMEAVNYLALQMGNDNSTKLQYFDDNIRSDEFIVKELVISNPIEINGVHPDFFDDREKVKELLSVRPDIFMYLNKELRSDKDLFDIVSDKFQSAADYYIEDASDLENNHQQQNINSIFSSPGGI